MLLPRHSCYHAGAVTPPFRKVLIANRGEIAVRVIRACREMGIATVAVYSEADRESLHVLLADEAVLLGPPPAAESYLASTSSSRRRGPRAPRRCIPGYGFLAENAAFAEACAGRRARVHRPAARGHPVHGRQDGRAPRGDADEACRWCPAPTEPLADDAEAARVAAEVGYPVMIKAAMGGGGKGMRLVRAPGELAGALRAARSEAGAAFGDAAVYLERYVEEPRHIEIQVLGRRARQRRAPGRARVLDPAPAPEADRGEPLAVRHARDAARAWARRRARWRRPSATSTPAPSSSSSTASGSFYFLEMNTRLQVEHPVTELVTGRDLVKEQLRIAAGEKLGFTQDDVVATGLGHRVPHQCRGSARRLHPVARAHHQPAAGERALGARRLRRLRRATPSRASTTR